MAGRIFISVCGFLLLTVSIFPASTINGAILENRGDEPGEHEEDEDRGSKSLLLKEGDLVVDSPEGRIRVWDAQNHKALRQNNLLVAYLSLQGSTLSLPAFFAANHALYVLRGTGRIGVVHQGGSAEVDIKTGDVYAVTAGHVHYYVNTNSTAELQIFLLAQQPEPMQSLSGYHTFRPFYIAGGTKPKGVLCAFDEDVLGQAFNASGDEIRHILSSQTRGPIVRLPRGHPLLQPRPRTMRSPWRWLQALGAGDAAPAPYNIFDESRHDVDLRGGWSTVVNNEKLDILKKIDIGAFVVALRVGSQLAPHYNPWGTEVAMVTHGSGRVQVAHQNGTVLLDEHVKKGDVFVVPRFHAVVHVASSAEDFEFAGFSTTSVPKSSIFMAGSNSILKALDSRALSAAFDVPEDRLRDFLEAQDEATIISTSTARDPTRMEKVLEFFGQGQVFEPFM